MEPSCHRLVLRVAAARGSFGALGRLERAILRVHIRSVLLLAPLSVACCGGSQGVPPSAVSPLPTVTSVEVRCPTPLLIGEVQSCVAIAHLSTGEAPSVRAESWSVSSANIATIGADGAVRGRQGGDAVVTATYRGSAGTTVVSVLATDAIHLSTIAFSGGLGVGASATARATGFYSVDSLPTGLLSLVVRDQNGPLALTSPVVVSRGGDAFALAASFAVPASSMRICQSVVLAVGAQVVTAPSGPNAETVGCVTVQAH